MSQPGATPTRRILTPTTLNRLARDLLEKSFPGVWVEGEISNLARPASGHLYFGLKDSGAQIRCAMFRMQARALRFPLANGLKVLARGRIGLYEPRGDYQLIVEQMEEAGAGALRRQYEELKARLDAEGLFAAERKRPLPRMPRRIGVLSSPSGAAVHDVLSVLARRFPLLEVDLLPVPVQGREAAPAIIEMLDRAQRSARYDALLLTRGGGSLEDLWAFNEEPLVRAVATCGVPLVVAIGHEIDFTLAEFAADLRAPTPSAAAELLAPDGTVLARQVLQAQQQLMRCWQHHQQRTAQRLDHLQSRLRAQRPQARLQRGAERLGGLHRRLWRARPLPRLQERLQTLDGRLRSCHPRRRLEQDRRALMALHGRLLAARRRASEQRAAKLAEVSRGLHAVSPLATLERGYAILFDGSGHSIRSVSAITADATVTAQLSDGSVKLRRADPHD